MGECEIARSSGRIVGMERNVDCSAEGGEVRGNGGPEDDD